MQNKSVVLGANGELSVEDRAMPVPGPDEVLVKVGACGVCSSDVPRNIEVERDRQSGPQTTDCAAAEPGRRNRVARNCGDP